MRRLALLAVALAALVAGSTANSAPPEDVPAAERITSSEFEVTWTNPAGKTVTLWRGKSNDPDHVFHAEGNAANLATTGPPETAPGLARASATRCINGIGWTRIGRAATGTVTYKYTQRKTWCFDGIRYISSQFHWPEVCCTTLNWHYVQQISDTQSFFLWNGGYRGGHWSRIQGQFSNGAGPFSSSGYPWVRVRVFANGNWDATSG